jgi:hypothetical protein
MQLFVNCPLPCLRCADRGSETTFRLSRLRCTNAAGQHAAPAVSVGLSAVGMQQRVP